MAANPDLIARITITGRIGDPLILTEDALRNQAVGPGDYGWTADLNKKGKWIPITISPLRIGKPSIEIYNRLLEGLIYFFEKDRAQAIAALKANARELLATEIARFNTTIESIDG